MPLLVVHETGQENAERTNRAVGGAFDGQGGVRAALREVAGLDHAGSHPPYFATPTQCPGLPTASRGGTTVGEERTQR